MPDLTLGAALNAVLIWIWLIAGPFVPLLVLFGVGRKRFQRRRLLFAAGATHLALYILAIAIPFYLQGYAAIYPARPSAALGWTRFSVVGDFAYVFTFPAYGYLWLMVGVVAVAFGESSSRRLVDSVVRTLHLCAFGWLLLDLHRFNETLNSILE